MQKTIYFKNWVQSNILTLRDIKIVNGKVDHTYLFNCIAIKHNIIAELALLQKCLKRYKHLLQDHTPSNIQNEIPSFITEDREFTDVSELKSKFFYTHIVKQKAQKTHMEYVWS